MKREPSGSLFHGAGFTIVELVVILVVVGILAVLVGSRLPGAFADARAVRDELAAQVQYARKVAVAQRRGVFVLIGANQSLLCYSAAGTCTGTDAVAGPTGDAPYAVCFNRRNCAAPPTNLAVTAAAFQFDGLGRPRDSTGVLLNAPLVVNVTGEDTQAVTVWHETGYVL